MKLINKLFITGVALAMSTSLASAADYTMRISHQFPPSHHTAQRLQQMAKDVAQETDGKVEVQIFGAAQLFKPNQHHAAVASGQLESAIILTIQWGGSLPEMAVTQIPYLMNAPAKQKAFLGSEAASILEQKLLDKRGAQHSLDRRHQRPGLHFFDPGARYAREVQGREDTRTEQVVRRGFERHGCGAGIHAWL